MFRRKRQKSQCGTVIFVIGSNKYLKTVFIAFADRNRLHLETMQSSHEPGSVKENDLWFAADLCQFPDAEDGTREGAVVGVGQSGRLRIKS